MGAGAPGAWESSARAVTPCQTTPVSKWGEPKTQRCRYTGAVAQERPTRGPPAKRCCSAMRLGRGRVGTHRGAGAGICASRAERRDRLGMPVCSGQVNRRLASLRPGAQREQRAHTIRQSLLCLCAHIQHSRTKVRRAGQIGLSHVVRRLDAQPLRDQGRDAGSETFLSGPVEGGHARLRAKGEERQVGSLGGARFSQISERPCLRA